MRIKGSICTDFYSERGFHVKQGKTDNRGEIVIGTIIYVRLTARWFICQRNQ